MTADQYRRSIRAELHTRRCQDGDHTEARLWHDARELDRRMVEAGYSRKHATSWGSAPPGLGGPQNAGLAAFRLRKSTIAPEEDTECHLEHIQQEGAAR